MHCLYKTNENTDGVLSRHFPVSHLLAIQGNVVRALENHWNLVECFSPERQNCQILPSIQLKHVFYRALNAFLEELDQCTLADIPLKRL